LDAKVRTSCFSRSALFDQGVGGVMRIAAQNASFRRYVRKPRYVRKRRNARVFIRFHAVSGGCFSCGPFKEAAKVS
jgi:hypothetical protein